MNPFRNWIANRTNNRAKSSEQAAYQAQAMEEAKIIVFKHLDSAIQDVDVGMKNPYSNRQFSYPQHSWFLAYSMLQKLRQQVYNM